jgi:hypothetical protein
MAEPTGRPTVRRRTPGPELVAGVASAVLALVIVGALMASTLPDGIAPSPSGGTSPAASAGGSPTTSPSSAGSPTPSPDVVILFADGFESGDLSAWTVNSRLVPTTAEYAAGSYGARATATNGDAFAYRDLPATTDVTVSVMFKVIGDPPGSAYILRTATMSGKYGAGLYRSASGALALRNAVTATTTSSSATVATGAWHELRLHQIIAGPASSVVTWLDGVRVDDLSAIQDLGIDPIGRFQIGDDNSSRTFDLVFDQALATTPKGAVPSPSPSASVPAGSPGPSPSLAASIDPGSLADLRAALVLHGRFNELASELEPLLAARRPDTASIARVLRAVNALATSASDVADRLIDDPATTAIGTGLGTAYQAIREQVSDGLALGLANTAGYVNAGRATIAALDALDPLADQIRAALAVAGG